MSKIQDKPRKKPKKKPKKLARRASKYDLYQRSVQEPSADVRFMKRIFKKEFGRRPYLLREDFCGTGYLSCEWVKDHRLNRAVGHDIDAEPLEWGLEHNVSRLTDEQRSRLDMRLQDALAVVPPSVELLAACNFSYFLFKTRDALRDYFRAAYQNIQDEGLFVLDMMGGPDSQQEGPEDRRLKGFTYVWDQEHFDPITSTVRCSIHFEFPDGSRMKRAFRYDWRLWTPPEVREVLSEVGFVDTAVYWEGTDAETEDGNGVFTRRESAENCECWIAYIVATKRPSP